MRPKAAFQLSPLHSLIALIILCNSCCLLCPHFYRRAAKAMVRLWLWNSGAAHVGSIKSAVFLYRPHGRLTQIPHVRFQKARAGDKRRRWNERQRGDYEGFYSAPSPPCRGSTPCFPAGRSLLMLYRQIIDIWDALKQIQSKQVTTWPQRSKRKSSSSKPNLIDAY